MARAGGYGRKKSDEYIGTTEAGYAEAITSAKAAGLTLEAWTLDAINDYAYRCEKRRLLEQYRHDREAAPSPSMVNAKDYEPRRPKPTPTAPAAGKGSGPVTGRSYRP